MFWGLVFNFTFTGKAAVNVNSIIKLLIIIVDAVLKYARAFYITVLFL